jgi:hypothetical protein
VLLTATDALRQRFEWQPDGIVLHELQTEAGPNRITEQLDRLPAVRSVPRFGDLAQDLERLFGAWDKSAKQFALVRERVTTPAAAADNAREASLHLVRLWARDEIRRLQSVRDLRQALALAARYQLVTPMSGAVVLETQAQYTATGLQPAEPTTVPMVPEPQTWALLLGGGLMLVVVAKRRRKVHAS